MHPRKKPAGLGKSVSSRLRRDLEVLIDWHRVRRQWQKVLLDTASLRHSERGQKLLIIANGPSAESLPEKFSSDFRTSGGKVMAMNWAHLNPAASEGKIDFYVSADRRMLEENEKSEKLRAFLRRQGNVVGFVPEFRLEQWQATLPTVRFFPFCHYYVKYLRYPGWGLSPIKPKAFTSHTGLHALQMASWMGFEHIFVIGFDNSYFQNFKLDQDNLITLTQTHAGEEPEFSRIKVVDTATYLERQASLFRDYWRFSIANVFNLDNASLTDAFQKTTFQHALHVK